MENPIKYSSLSRDIIGNKSNKIDEVKIVRSDKLLAKITTTTTTTERI